MVLRAFTTGLWLLIACASPAAAAQSEVSRGQYLTVVGDCQVCHTHSGRQGEPYAGGYPLHAWFGTVYSSNITPAKRTGIGNWTADQFYRALTQGVGPGGSHLYPAFPYPYFARVPRGDSDEIFAYLRTLKPVEAAPPADRLMFPANFRFMVTFWDWLFFPQGQFRPDPANRADWNHGGDIVHGLGHCGGCHTPKNFLFSDKPHKLLQGDVIDGWYAPNLTASPRTGLGRWTVADIETYLKTGSNRFERVVGSMQDVVRLSTGRMSESDRHAIAVYLKSLKAAPEGTPKGPPADEMRNGQTGFEQVCSACHEADPKDYPPLVHNAIVQFSNPTTMVRVILQGSQSVAPAGQTPGFSMPAFSTLSNAQIAEIATYVRNSWGNHASSVTDNDVAKLRDQLSQRD